MSTTDTADLEQWLAEPQRKRELLNPFDPSTPTTLLDAANELCRGYMQGEKDDYHLLQPHHAEWLDHLDSDEDLILNCHRDGLKTTVVLCYLALRLEYDDGFRAIWAMNNKTMAKKKTDLEFNRFVERNPWLVTLQESARLTDTIELKEFPNGSTLTASWLDGGIDGDRAHLLVLDDLIKARGDGNPEDVHEWAEGTAFPMVKKTGSKVLIGTRKRPDDIYAHYRDMGSFAVAEYPALLDVWDRAHTDGEASDRRPDEAHYTEVGDHLVLWPEARGLEWLEGERASMSDYRFYREYCLSFIGASGSLVDEADVNRLVDDGGCSIRREAPPRRLRPGEGEYTLVCFDPAQSPTGDNAAFTAWHIGRDGRRRLLDAIARTGMAPSSIKAALADLDERYDPAVIVIENNGMQQYVENDAIEFSPAMRAKVVGLPTTGKKHSWENGIPRLQTLVQRGSIQFHRGHEGTETFIEAMLSLDLEDGQIVGHTPDLIASWYMAEEAIRRLDYLEDRDETTSGVQPI